MFLFILSTDSYFKQNLVLISGTENLEQTLSDYIEMRSPFEEEFHYIGIWKVKEDNELFRCLEKLQNKFYRYRLMREKIGDSEWFNFKKIEPYPLVQAYLRNQSWIEKEVPVEEMDFSSLPKPTKF